MKQALAFLLIYACGVSGLFGLTPLVVLGGACGLFFLSPADAVVALRLSPLDFTTKAMIVGMSFAHGFAACLMAYLLGLGLALLH